MDNNSFSSRSRRLNVLAQHLSPSLSSSSSLSSFPNTTNTNTSSSPSVMSNPTSSTTTPSRMKSRWGSIPEAPRDPILGITLAFKEDKHPKKLNLGVGAYRTEEGEPFVLPVVREVEKKIAHSDLNKEYIPQDGLPAFKRETAKLILGSDSRAIQENRVATCQGISGTGSIRLGLEFIRQFIDSDAIVYVSNPTWGNHNKLVNKSGLNLRNYSYWDNDTSGLDLRGMLADIRSAPRGSVFILHACAHNPTGVDPTKEQWHQIADALQERDHLVFFDCAYQGFASGDPDRDAFAVRMFESRGIEFIVAQSYAKNFGLYGERIGAINFVCSDQDSARAINSQLKSIVRAMYSSPPLHGARLVSMTLSDPHLRRMWLDDLKGMANRIKEMRRCLYNALKERQTPGDWTHILEQIGMFSYTGLNERQVKHLTDKYHIYLTSNGRISMAGLSKNTCPYLADAIKDAVTNIN
eukprot:gb/GECH01012624.1/.p1 GENE.gb/GECH01012624.1/~~gb/GECH01012624.1/.p1  ORF type:complete len:466 (+),score=110.46 gb/GECH01012624.1/:1-1398(+)